MVSPKDLTPRPRVHKFHNFDLELHGHDNYAVNFFPNMCGIEEGFKNTAFFASPHGATGMDVTIYVPHSYIVANRFLILGKKFKI